MPKTPIRHEIHADGTTDIFTIPWTYIDKKYVKIALNGVDVTALVEWLSSNTIRVNPKPIQNTIMVITRDTPSDRTLTAFQDGSRLTDSDIKTGLTQSLHVMEEVLDEVDVHTANLIASSAEAVEAAAQAKASERASSQNASRASDAVDRAEDAVGQAETAVNRAENAAERAEAAAAGEFHDVTLSVTTQLVGDGESLDGSYDPGSGRLVIKLPEDLQISGTRVELTDRVDLNFSTVAASSKAVKKAYDRGSEALVFANEVQTASESAAAAAQAAADNAQTSANAGLFAASVAQATADNAQTVANAAQEAANTASLAMEAIQDDVAGLLAEGSAPKYYPDGNTIFADSANRLYTPVAGASSATQAGTFGQTALAATRDTSSVSLAATPAGVWYVVNNMSTTGNSGQERLINASGSWTAPYNGVYTFLLLGGGGGGGGGTSYSTSNPKGGAGGAGGCLIVSLSLTANQTISLVIGAGGAGGAQGSGATAQGAGKPGGNGGETKVTVGSAVYTSAGGGGGGGGMITGVGGDSDTVVTNGGAGASGANAGLNPWAGTYGKGGTGGSGRAAGTAGTAGRIRITW